MVFVHCVQRVVLMMAGAHALMREDVVKSDGVAGGSIKGVCVSKDLPLSLVTKTLIGSSMALSLAAHEIDMYKINLDQLFKKIGKTNNWGNDKEDFGKIIPQ
ncbi:hypothetical protein QTP88_029491 [Uroleucon formosanum]